MKSSKPILIFDGVCNFCNWWVDFVLKRDKKGKVLFTANQEPAGQAILAKFGITTFGDPDSVYLYQDGHLYSYSSAALRLAKLLPFPWFLMAGFLIIPRFIRDGIYKWIARNRYKWFGKTEACRLPQPGELERFLQSEEQLIQEDAQFALKAS
jgi:predicted DCC family thiol-disulfide oxidoreductase YuxK